jgi:restriction system protein
MEHPNGLSAAEAMSRLAESVVLTEYELQPLPRSGRPRYGERLRMATVDVARAGWLNKVDRKKWIVSEAGKRAYAEYQDPEVFYRQAIKLRHWSKYGGTSRFAAKQARDEIRVHLQNMDPYEFQSLVASLLRSMGYFIKAESPKGKDGGTDIVAWSDPLGVRPPRIRVQVKRYREGAKNTVEELRSFIAVLGKDEVGLFVTTSGFTRDAENEIRQEKRHNVTLVDLDRFVELWIEYYPKLDDSARRRLPLQPIYFLMPGIE